MSDTKNKYTNPIILAVLTGIIGVMIANYNEASHDTQSKADNAATKTSVNNLERQMRQLPTREWLKSQFASKDDIRDFRYRIERNEADARSSDARVRNVIGLINRLCQIHDIVCSTRNTGWHAPLRKHWLVRLNAPPAWPGGV